MDVPYDLHQLLCKRQRDIRILPVYATTATHRHWLWLAEFSHEALEGTVALRDGKPGL